LPTAARPHHLLRGTATFVMGVVILVMVAMRVVSAAHR
jgi:hypothetical protein